MAQGASGITGDEIRDLVATYRSAESGDLTSKHGGRELSWEYCFSYFQTFPKPTEQMELSCLQLGYYLASWGMLRGSAYIAQHANVKHFTDAVELIEKHNPAMAGKDAADYQDPDFRRLVLDVYRELGKVLLPHGGTPETLVTKVMLGVWGVIPAYDTYVKKALKDVRGAAFSTPNESSLKWLSDLYQEHAETIEALAEEARQPVTFDRESGPRPYTKMKIIDMFAFQMGMDIERGLRV